MLNGEIDSGFNGIVKGLTDVEKSALIKISGKADLKEAIMFFFEELRTNSAVYTFKNWVLLSINEKEAIGAALFRWYKILLFFDHSFGDRCKYTFEDDIRLQIRIQELTLHEKSDYEKHIEFLNRKINEITEVGGSKILIKWMKTELRKSVLHIRPKRQIQFRLNGIDANKLVDELEERKYFSSEFKNQVIDWFNGKPPVEPIPMKVSASIFISIIADICDIRPKLILNTKEFCYTYIEQSFLFNGAKAESSYIKKVMKPNNENRVSRYGNTIPDIQQYKTFK
jgi:hypothetical protein